MLGRIEPRLWTPPLRELTPETSYGFDVVDFARDVLKCPLDPWQEWLVIHAGELREDGVTPRFRKLLVLVSRQQGKTFLLIVLTLYWLFVERQKTILSTSTNLGVAKESWKAAGDLAETNKWLSRELKTVRNQLGEETIETKDGCRYKVAASNRKGGRGLTLNRLILDELREHRSFDAFDASVPATTAVKTAQVWGISNQGDMESIVLDHLRLPALEYIERGTGPDDLGLFEWSAPDGSRADDLDALAMSNPNLGRRTPVEPLLNDGRRAMATGGSALASFRTENMCMRVHLLNPAVDPDHWRSSAYSEYIDMAQHRDRLACCFDISMSEDHASLLGAVTLNGVTYVETLHQWDGLAAVRKVRAQLPGLIERIRPRSLGWFPQGPAASVALELEKRKDNRMWPPRNVEVTELRGEVGAVCMGLSSLVSGGNVRHPDDAMLTQHINACQKLDRGDMWVFSRKGDMSIDGAYACAGAVYLSRKVTRRPRVVAADMTTGN